MAETFAVRILAAEDALAEAVDARDRFYPSSDGWKSAQGVVEEWMSVLSNLRREAREAGA